MSITQPVAGAYTSAWNSLVQDYTSNGFELDFTSHAEELNETDIYGQSLIDWVQRGATIKCRMEYKVYSLINNIPLFWPWSFALGTFSSLGFPLGRLASDIAKPLVLTVVNNTSAAVAGPATITGSKALLSPQYNGRLLFTSKIRVVPIEMVCLPSESGGDVSAIAIT